MASVSKLNGLRSKVAGSSFIESTNTNNTAAIKAGLIIGNCIPTKVSNLDLPKTRAASPKSGFRVENPDSMVPYAIVRNLTI